MAHHQHLGDPRSLLLTLLLLEIQDVEGIRRILHQRHLTAEKARKRVQAPVPGLRTPPPRYLVIVDDKQSETLVLKAERRVLEEAGEKRDSDA